MRVVPTKHTSLDTLNKHNEPIQLKDDLLMNHSNTTNTALEMEGSFRQSTLGTVQKKKPLPKIPPSKMSTNLTSEQHNSTISLPQPLPIINTKTSGYVSVGPSWITSNQTVNQSIVNNTNNQNSEDVSNQQEVCYLSESPSAITNFQLPPPVTALKQQQPEQQSNNVNKNNGNNSNNNRFSNYYYNNNTIDNSIPYNTVNQHLLLTQSHNSMDYYSNNAVNADPYYSHQYGYATVYNHGQPHQYYGGNGYYNQIQNYTTAEFTTNSNEMNNMASISTNSGWKTSTSTCGIPPKNMMVVRSDSLKIESTTPIPFSKGGHLPLETHLEKPFEPTIDEQQQQFQPTLQKKVSKQELYTFEAPSSILLMKLDQSVRQQGNITIVSPLLYGANNSSSSSSSSGTETPTTTSSNSNNDNSFSTPLSYVSNNNNYPPVELAEPPTLLANQKQRHSMPLLSTQKQQEQDTIEEEEVDVSFSAVEKYFQQPNNVSPVSSTRIPSPWGTTTSRSATTTAMVRQNISRISTGSIPNMMSVQTVQLPDEVAVVLTASKSSPPVRESIVNNKAEQYFNNEDDQQKRKQQQSSKYSLSIASCSLINIRSNTKLYRRMAIKTRNKETQMTYAKYLLQISKLYEKNNHTSVSVVASKSSSSLPSTGNNTKKSDVLLESPAETRHRLLSEAGYWIEKLAKAGLPEALFIKGRWHLLGPQAEECVMHGYEKVQEAKAFKCFLTASKGGWTDAHYELAHLWKKRGNYAKAIQCYEKGAKEKHTLSIYKMAKILLRGQLKKQKDIPKGMAFLKQAADMDDPASAEPAFVLGCIHANEFDRIGIQRNVSTAIDDDSPAGKVNYGLALKYLKKSAQHGYPDAIYFMGQVSETGMLGQLCDSWQAYQHYMKAAEVNHAGAMLDLSRIYSQGISGLLAAQKDMAFKWCKRSADLGFDQAEYVLGKYYEDGIGVAPDFPLALEYFGKAASKGYQPAAEKLNRPLADGSRRKLKKNIMDQNRSDNYLTVVVSEPRVKRDDDDDDDDYTPNNPNSRSSSNGQKNNNNVCTIQ